MTAVINIHIDPFMFRIGNDSLMHTQLLAIFKTNKFFSIIYSFVLCVNIMLHFPNMDTKGRVVVAEVTTKEDPNKQ